ncbi:MAG: response regulator [Nannocystaceae bacterium]
MTDLQMPGGSGLDLLKALEGRDPLVPVIIVTGDMSLQPATAAVREHAFDYLTKPVSRDVLLSTVSRAIDSRRATQARVNAEQRLREEHRQLAIRHQRTAMLLSVLYNRAVEGIIVLDAQGRLVDASDSFVALVGRPLYELLDADIGELFDLHPTEGDIQSRVVELAAAPLSRGHWRGEMTVRAARGRRLPARVSLSVCEVPSVDAASEQTRYVMALLYYETAHEEMSRQLQQADRLATMGLLAGSAAHEIRNELGPLLGYLTMLEQGNFEVAAADMIKVMRDSVRRVQEHIEQILAPLRPRVRTRGAVSMRDVIEGILTLLRRAGRLRRMRLELDVPEEDVIVHADKTEVHQIGLNLLTNAIDALGDGGGGDRGTVRVKLSYDGPFGVLRAVKTPVRASRITCAPACSSRSSPPRAAAAPAWGCRWCSTSCAASAVASRSTRPPMAARLSPSRCRAISPAATRARPKPSPDARLVARERPVTDARRLAGRASPTRRGCTRVDAVRTLPTAHGQSGSVAVGRERARGSTDPRVAVVLLERTLFEPPRLAAMQRWSGAIRRRFPQAELVPYVWHWISHSREDGLRTRAARRPAGADHELGALLASEAATQAWEITRGCACRRPGGARVVLRTGASLTPGALGRKRPRAFVESAAPRLGVIWEPEGLWEPDTAQQLAHELGITLLCPAFEGGRLRYEAQGGDVLVSRAVWLRADGVGAARRLDAGAIDALAMHIDVVPDTTIVFTGPRALPHLGALYAQLDPGLLGSPALIGVGGFFRPFKTPRRRGFRGSETRDGACEQTRSLARLRPSGRPASPWRPSSCRPSSCRPSSCQPSWQPSSCRPSCQPSWQPSSCRPSCQPSWRPSSCHPSCQPSSCHASRAPARYRLQPSLDPPSRGNGRRTIRSGSAHVNNN